MEGGKAVGEAGAVTRRRVRCSAWLGVGVCIVDGFRLKDSELLVHPTLELRLCPLVLSWQVSWPTVVCRLNPFSRHLLDRRRGGKME